MIIGITGGTGCGKSTLLSVIEDCGGRVIDCDKLYHQLLETDPALLSEIDARFPGMVDKGVLKRKELGQLVFSDKHALADLNRITHAAVKKAVVRQLSDKPDLAAIDAIGLFESGLNRLCDITVAVTAPTEQRIQRLMARDGISREYALARMEAQPSEETFVSRCDQVLHNDETEEIFRSKCLSFLKLVFFKDSDII